MTKNKNARIGATNTAAGKPVYAFRQLSTTAVVFLVIPETDNLRETHGRPMGGRHARR